MPVNSGPLFNCVCECVTCIGLWGTVWKTVQLISAVETYLIIPCHTGPALYWTLWVILSSNWQALLTEIPYLNVSLSLKTSITIYCYPFSISDGEDTGQLCCLLWLQLRQGVSYVACCSSPAACCLVETAAGPRIDQTPPLFQRTWGVRWGREWFSWMHSVLLPTWGTERQNCICFTK